MRCQIPVRVPDEQTNAAPEELILSKDLFCNWGCKTGRRGIKDERKPLLMSISRGVSPFLPEKITGISPTVRTTRRVQTPWDSSSRGVALFPTGKMLNEDGIAPIVPFCIFI